MSTRRKVNIYCASNMVGPETRGIYSVSTCRGSQHAIYIDQTKYQDTRHLKILIYIVVGLHVGAVSRQYMLQRVELAATEGRNIFSHCTSRPKRQHILSPQYVVGQCVQYILSEQNTMEASVMTHVGVATYG